MTELIESLQSVQRYKQVRPNDEKQPGYSTRAGQGEQAFPYQNVAPQLKLPERGQQIAALTWERGHHMTPPLLVADDDSLAIVDNDSTEQKAFYSAPDHLDQHNAALASAGSAIVLQHENSRVSIPLPDNGTKDLVKTVPRLRENVHASMGKIFKTAVCADVAKAVQGSAHDLIMLGGQGQSRALKTSELNNRFGNTEQVTPLQGRGRRQAEENLLLDEYARAFVGQSYVIQDVSSREEAKGFHVAAVVATSDNRGDSITLENYNRMPQLTHVYDEFGNQIRERAEKKKYAFLKLLFSASREPVVEESTVGLIAEWLFPDKDANMRRRLLDQALGFGSAANAAWHFKMYGPQRPQTFHDKAAKQLYGSDPHAEPLTFVTSGVPCTQIVFRRGAASEDTDAGPTLEGFLGSVARNYGPVVGKWHLQITLYINHEGRTSQARKSYIFNILDRVEVNSFEVATKKVAKGSPLHRRADVVFKWFSRS